MWAIVIVLVVGLAAMYVTWLAARVDRLHTRVAGTFFALDAQSVRRATATVGLGHLDRADGAFTAASAVFTAEPEEREWAENELTRNLRELAGRRDAAAIQAVREPSRRLALARQMHNSCVREALTSRRRPIVRLLGLARKHPSPRFFDIEDPSLEDILDGH